MIRLDALEETTQARLTAIEDTISARLDDQMGRLVRTVATMLDERGRSPATGSTLGGTATSPTATFGRRRWRQCHGAKDEANG